MEKNLKVIKAFSVLDEGDILTLSADGKNYTIECEEQYDFPCTNNSIEFTSSFTGQFSIGVDYATYLIENGYLKEVQEKKTFVNIFDEIDNLLNTYTKQLNENTDEVLPPCVELERKTVLNNLITLLTYLKTLKK